MPPRARSGTARRKPTTTTRAFLFSDLRDYTSFVEAKGDAAAARLLREYRTLVRREVARHEGAEVKTEGDSFYVVFDRPSGALECAVAVLRAAYAQNAKDPTAPLRIGVGLHAGETVEYDDQFVGSAVNIASRLAGKAVAMELLISDTLRGLVRTSQDLAMTDRGPLELKGVSEPIRAWSVEWRAERRDIVPPPAPPVIASAPASGPAAGQLLCPVVVGRANETARFDAALSAAVGGAGQTVVLGGEAGVGKTKFVREAQAHATARGARVLIGLTHQSDGALPYAPFVSAIRSGFHGLDRDELGRVLQRSAPDLSELFPELGRTDQAAAPTGLERHRLSVAFQHLFRAFARETPVLVVLEDLHWADETSLELLQHLARELRDARVLLLATYRSDEMHRRHPFLRALAELQRERLVDEIRLARLTPEETRELIRATMATRDPNVRVTDEFRDALYSRSDGNPFFTEELLKALVDSGGVFLQDGGWARKPIDQLEIPGSIREAVRARIEELSDGARRTLSVASVIGLRFGFDTLRTAADIDETTLEGHLREFIEAQLVVEGDDRNEEYAFRHALTREVVYDDLLVRERKRVHRRVAEVLGADPKTEPALLAQHLIAAGERERAVPVLLDAASRAMRADAPREAVTHYESALDLGIPDEQLAGTLENVADAYHLFDSARSLNAANEAASAFRERGDRRGSSRALRLASRNHWIRGDVGPATALAREAIEVLAGEECVESARALAHLAGLRMTQSDWSDAIRVADRAIEQGERFDDVFALSNALISKGTAMAPSDPVAAVEVIDRGRRLALDAGLAATVLRGWNNQSLWLGMIGWPLERQLAFLREGIAWGRAHGVERANLHWLLNTFGAVAVNSGQLQEGLAAYAEIERDGGWVGGPVYLLYNGLVDGPATVRARVVAAAEHTLALGESAEPQWLVPTFLITAFILEVLAQRDAAREWTTRLVERCEPDEGFREMLAGPWHHIAIAVALTAGPTELVELCASGPRAPTPQLEARKQDAIAFGRAALRGDASAAGDALARYWRSVEEQEQPFLAVPLTLAVARRFGDAATRPEWREPLAKARAFVAKAGMRWLLEALPEPVVG